MTDGDQPDPTSWHSTSDSKDNDETKNDYLLLKRLAESLCDEVDDLISEQHQAPESCSFYFQLMVGLFLINQLHYLEDILKIIPGRTSEVIARSMLEGYLKLSWVNLKPNDRALRWFNYFFFQELKTIERRRARGEDVSDDYIELVRQISERAQIHLKTSGKKALSSGEKLNPFGHFKRDWTGKSAYDLATKLELTELYARFYDPYNDWVHWSAKGLLKASETSDSSVSYTFRSYYQSVTALIAGIESILGCLEIWKNVFQVKLPVEIEAIKDQFHPYSI